MGTFSSAVHVTRAFSKWGRMLLRTLTRTPWIFTIAVGASAAPRPVLVTIDDLPMAGALHPDPAERQRITTSLLAVLAKHHYTTSLPEPPARQSAAKNARPGGKP